jgi:hypothetical protein
MNDDQYANRFKTIMKQKYKEIGEIVMPERPADKTPENVQEFACDTLAGQAALCTAMSGNITALTKSGLIPPDLGHQLLLASRQLTIDLQKAIKAQATLNKYDDATVTPSTLH